MNNKHTIKADELFDVIVAIKTKDDAKKFFTDLCTPGEITAMATLSRVSKCVKRGEGYRKILGGGKTTEKR